MEKEERMKSKLKTPLKLGTKEFKFLDGTTEFDAIIINDSDGDGIAMIPLDIGTPDQGSEICIAVNERASLLKERDALYDLVMEVAGDLEWIAEPSNMIVPVVVRKKARASLMSIDAFIKKHEEPNA